MDTVISTLAAFPSWLRITMGSLTLVGVLFLAGSRYHAFRAERARRKLVEDEYAGKFLKQFNDEEIRRWMNDYVTPHCSTVDPTNRDGDEYLADIRQNIFDYMDSNIESRDKRYNLILADTGMGKTMFCINYYSHLKAKYPDKNICLVSLTSESASSSIRSVLNKSNTILIADAFDEDSHALGRGRDRLAEILEMSADFKSVIITCRSQYFIADDAIPRETPLPILVPRKLGQSQNSALIRCYISPFSKSEVEQYLSKIFPIYKPWLLKYRNRAKSLIKSVPDLVHRPMLLERLPEIARTPSHDAELYELYDLLVTGWIERESRWISVDNLRTVSLELAILMYRDFNSGHGRMSLKEVNLVADQLIRKNPEWEHLSSRSLLNRDSAGMYKFAHKSILEFLVVKAACEGDDRAYAMPWTPFMKELFISWGHSPTGRTQSIRAKAILNSENGRAHIAPFYDMLSTSPIRGYPDFKQICERRSTSTGERIAPATWRESAIIIQHDGKQAIVRDLEYNLNWVFIPNYLTKEVPPLTIIQALSLQSTHPTYRFPSFEQVVTLLEGIYNVRSRIFKNGLRFIIGDKPSRNTFLVVEIGRNPKFVDSLATVWKKQNIVGTSMYITCYELHSFQINYLPGDFYVDQLYISEDTGILI